MAEPAEMAGAWTLTADARACPLVLSPIRVEQANAHALDAAGARCAAAMLGREVAGWRPVPDGIALVAPDRLALATFANGETTLPDGRHATLRRAG